MGLLHLPIAIGVSYSRFYGFAPPPDSYRGELLPLGIGILKLALKAGFAHFLSKRDANLGKLSKNANGFKKWFLFKHFSEAPQTPFST
jgi:hypothetical protein